MQDCVNCMSFPAFDEVPNRPDILSFYFPYILKTCCDEAIVFSPVHTIVTCIITKIARKFTEIEGSCVQILVILSAHCENS